jgi:4'-phosphopantetheinyl transferase
MSEPQQVAPEAWILPPGEPVKPLVSPAPGAAPHVWLVRVAEHRESAEDALTILDEEERARHAAFLRPADRDRYAAAHAALRRLLGAYLGMEPGEVTVGREQCPLCGGPHGRPAVLGSGLHFSLSHSGELVLLAFAAAPVGIDVEELRDQGAIAEVSKCLHPYEQAELSALTPAGRIFAFLRCWTRKEAYLKGTGEGLSGGLSHTYVGAGELPATVPGWTLWDITVDAGHTAAVAMRQAISLPYAMP